jgi:hypothetical protein
MLDEPWMERVRFGDFSAAPQPLTWAKSYDFARLIDGYELAHAAGIVDLGDFAFRARQNAEEAGEWSGTASELWCILFLEHRAARFARDAFDRDPLLDSLCLTLRFALQIVSDEERDVLVGFIEAERKRCAVRVSPHAAWPAAA